MARSETEPVFVFDAVERDLSSDAMLITLQQPIHPDEAKNSLADHHSGITHLTGSVFELQLVHRGIPPKALKRGNITCH